MTAKHRKSKNNHKHEENFFKNDAAESDVRGGGGSSSVPLVLFIVTVIGGVVGLWFCFQQHQTLTHLTDSLAAVHMKMMKLQSAHEELRQSGTKVRIESLKKKEKKKKSHPHPQDMLCIFMGEINKCINRKLYEE